MSQPDKPDHPNTEGLTKPIDNDSLLSPFASAELSPPANAQWRAKRRIATAMRELSDTLMTSAPEAHELDALAELLEKNNEALKTSPRLYGVRGFSQSRCHGTPGEVNHELNAVGGWSNPVSPGLNIWLNGDEASAEVSLGWAYEGPPGCVHGGFIAAVFDQFLGMAHMAAGQPGMTGRLEVHYHRPTPLNTDIKLHGKVAQAQGRKTVVIAEMRVNDEITATAEGLFIRPKQPLTYAEER